MRVIFKLVFAVLLITFLFLTYLTLIGIETDKFNSQIKEEIKTINKDLDVDLKKIKLILDPIQFKLNIKTLGSRFKNKNEIVEIESIKAEISLRSLINSKFSVKNLEISTKSIEVNNLIAFIRSLKNTPQLFILEKIIDKGYLIADIKLEFDTQGKIKDNYTIRGFVKDIKFSLLKKYNFKELSFNFEFKKDNLFLSNTSLDFNNLGLISEEILIQNKKNNFYISGKIDNKILNFNKDNLELFINPFFPDLKIEKLNFSSKNTFSLILNKKFQFKDLKINSKISIDELVINNSLGLEKFFPQVKENITLISNDLEVKYTKDNLLIAGNGDLLFQNNKDSLSYTLNKKDNIFDFKTQIKIKDNPLKINFLNYEKNNKDEAFIKFEGFEPLNFSRRSTHPLTLYSFGLYLMIERQGFVVGWV